MIKSADAPGFKSELRNKFPKEQTPFLLLYHLRETKAGKASALAGGKVLSSKKKNIYIT